MLTYADLTEDRHAQCAYLAEILSPDYPLDPAEADPIRVRAEQSLVRRPLERWEITAQDAADLLEQHVTSRFPFMDEWLVEWRETNGIRGLRVLWAHGPSWLSVRAFCDNYAAVAVQGLYAPVPAPEAQILADYIFCVQHDEHEHQTVEVPWLTWGWSEGPWEEEWQEHLGDAPVASGRARS